MKIKWREFLLPKISGYEGLHLSVALPYLKIERDDLYRLPLIGTIILRHDIKFNIVKALKEQKHVKKLEIIELRLNFRELMELYHFGAYNNYSNSLQKKVNGLSSRWIEYFDLAKKLND